MRNAAVPGIASERWKAVVASRARPRLHADALRATVAATSGALLAIPWRLETPAVLAIAAVWLASVVLLGRMARPDDDVVGRGQPDHLSSTLVAVLLAGLVRPAAGALVGGGWLALRAARRWRPMPALRATVVDTALPASVAWLALGGGRPIEAGAQTSVGAVSALWLWLGQNAVALSVVVGWAAVIAAVRGPSHGSGGRALLAAGAGWAVVLVAIAASGNVLAATSALAAGIGIWSLGFQDGAGDAAAARRADLARAGLLLAAGCLGLAR